MASCFFLFATLLVYATIPKLRPTKDGMEYTKLMLHYTFAMFMAFICLATVQLTPTLNNDSPGFCGFLGKYELILLLVEIRITVFEATYENIVLLAIVKEKKFLLHYIQNILR